MYWHLTVLWITDDLSYCIYQLSIYFPSVITYIHVADYSGWPNCENLHRLAWNEIFDLDQSELLIQSLQVNATARKARPNKVASRPEFWGCLYLQVCWARAFLFKGPYFQHLLTAMKFTCYRIYAWMVLARRDSRLSIWDSRLMRREERLTRQASRFSRRETRQEVVTYFWAVFYMYREIIILFFKLINLY